MDVYRTSSGDKYCQSFITVNGHEYRIYTSKYGRAIKCSVYPLEFVNRNEKGEVTSYQSFMMESTVLVKQLCPRVTAKQLIETHSKGLIEFDNYIKSQGSIKKELPEIGDILFLDGYGKTKGSRDNEHIIYEICPTSFGINYKTIERSTFELQTHSHPRPYAKKFGIGMYYEKGYRFEGSDDDFSNFILTAMSAQKEIELEKKRLEQERIDKNATEQEHLKKTFPYLVINPQSKQEVKKNLQNLLSKTFVNTKFTIKTETNSFTINWSNGPTEQEVRNTASLFVSYSRDETGDFYDYTPSNFNELFGGVKYLFYNNTIVEQQEQESVNTENTDIELIDYSPSSIAVIGDTKPIKDTLKKLGGRFNFRLSCGAGWIFPKFKESEVKSALNL